MYADLLLCLTWVSRVWITCAESNIVVKFSHVKLEHSSVNVVIIMLVRHAGKQALKSVVKFQSVLGSHRYTRSGPFGSMLAYTESVSPPNFYFKVEF